MPASACHAQAQLSRESFGLHVSKREYANRGLGMRAALLPAIGALALSILCCAQGSASTRSVNDASARAAPTKLPTWLWGEWRREWISKGKIKSSALDVHYLQTPTYFADIRVAKVRSGMSAAQSFADLTDQQLHMLAAQSGFTGQMTVEGNVATWSDEITFQPPDGIPDQGRLQRIPPDRMHEHGLDGSYIESWRHVTAGGGKFLVVRVEHAGRLERTLVVVGNQFVFVRNRAKDLPRAPSFDALIETTKATRDQIVEYLDCEFSVGRVRGESVPWEIQLSTLPWREGHHLDFVEQISGRDGEADLMPRAIGNDQLMVPVNTLSPREIKALFGG